ncbi:MAG: hypothetical protein IPJ19_13180 [Planctomycetes bacterium]|nr:hypothetical protein [Planctomycetota bacterium]
MAVQIETQGQLAEFTEILSRRRWQLALPALLMLTLGVALAVFIPKKYLIVTQVEVRPVSVSFSGKEADNAGNQIRSNERIRKVLEEMKRTEYLLLGTREQGDFVNDVRDDLKVKTEKPTGAGPSTSTFVTIEYMHVNVKFAMDFLKALRDDWKQDVIDRDRNKVDNDAKVANEEVAALEVRLTGEEDALTRLYKDNKITTTQPIPGGSEQRSEDPEFQRLQKQKDELEKTRLDLDQAERRYTDFEVRLNETPPKLSEEQLLQGVNTSSELIAIEKQIFDKQAELERYRDTHSKYKILSEQISQLTEKRDQIKRLATRSDIASIDKPNPLFQERQKQLDAARLERELLRGKKESLEAEILKKEAEVDRLYLVYSEIRSHRSLSDRYQEELTAASLRRDEKVTLAKQMASRLNDPFSVTQEALEPLKATEPNPWLIIAFALVAGLALGLAISLSAEYGRNCFRSVHDISRVMVAPVLGNIGSILTSRQRRVRLLRRALVGVASAAFIVSVGFVTWAWARNPELLSPQLRARIEQVRGKLR